MFCPRWVYRVNYIRKSSGRELRALTFEGKGLGCWLEFSQRFKCWDGSRIKIFPLPLNVRHDELGVEISFRKLLLVQENALFCVDPLKGFNLDFRLVPHNFSLDTYISSFDISSKLIQHFDVLAFIHENTFPPWRRAKQCALLYYSHKKYKFFVGSEPSKHFPCSATISSRSSSFDFRWRVIVRDSLIMRWVGSNKKGREPFEIHDLVFASCSLQIRVLCMSVWYNLYHLILSSKALVAPWCDTLRIGIATVFECCFIQLITFIVLQWYLLLIIFRNTTEDSF